jgi:restriction endonuclease S subunit
MAVANKNNKCFIVWSNKIEDRLDPAFYIFSVSTAGKDFHTIEKFAKVQGGFAFKSKEYLDKGVPLVRIQNIKDGSVDLDDTIFINEKYKTTLSRFLLKENDVLIAMTGATIGKIGKVSTSNLPAFLNQRVGRFVFNQEANINKDYLYYILQFPIFQNQIKKLSLGGAQPNISPNSIEKIKIPVPETKAQNKIVELMQFAYDKKTDKEQKAEKILNSIDDFILGELEVKMPEAQDKECFCINSQEVDKGRLDCYYYQPKFKQGEKSLKKANCKTEPLKNYITKIHYGASLKNNYVDEGIPLLRIQNLKPNRVVLTDIVKISEARRKELGNAFVSEGDLLISRSGSVGIVSVVPKEAEGFAFGSFMIKFCLNDKIDKDFVSIWLNNKISQLFIKREKIGAIQGNITIETIENLQIPTPPLATQKKLAAEVKERIADAKKINTEAKNEVEKAKQEVESIILGK